MVHTDSIETQKRGTMYIDKPAEELIKKLSTSSGLTTDDANKRLSQYGKNELVKKKGKTPIQIFLEQFHSFIIYILVGATIVSALIGEFADSIVILVILLFNAILGFIQEFKAEKSIEALRKMTSLKATVLRDGKEVLVDATDLVPGDLVLLETGNKVPADARLFEVRNLETNESSLTGESLPIKKYIDVLPSDTAIADQKNMVFSSTVVTGGRGKAIVIQTGMKTQIGNIARMIDNTEEGQTPLQEQLDKLGKFLGYAVIGICILVFLMGIVRNPDIMHVFKAFSPGDIQSYIILAQSLKEIFMTAVALAVAAVPEGLAAVVTVSMALGVQRMIKRHALVRKLPSVETLGCTTVICTDKTGTLTRNEMTVQKIYANGKTFDVSGAGYDKEGEFLHKGIAAKDGELNMLLTIGALNNDANLEGNQVFGDPTEASLIVSAFKAGLKKEELERKYPRLDEIGFDSTRKRMATVHKLNNEQHVFVKGAPDVIMGLCNQILVDSKIRTLSAADKKKILDANDAFANDALRVLAFAYKVQIGTKITEDKLIFVGLQAMIDPPRQTAKAAIAKCKTAGIKVVMITGDHATTATAIGKKLGLVGKSITGAELDKIKDPDAVVEDITIYARVNPEHKMRIVNALKNKGHIVAMTGDGVNDAPALKNADIGIAMGITGTDVCKEASDMILTDDNFASIVDAVEEGRGIDDNIRKFVNYLLSSNMGEVLVIFIAMIIGYKAWVNGYLVPILPLTAVQLLWMNVVTDGLPALALGVDPIAGNIMNRKPRNATAPILSHNMIANIAVTGILLCVFTLFLFQTGLNSEHRQFILKAQTMAFTGLVAFQLIRVYMVRSQYSIGLFTNKRLWQAIAISMLLQLFAVYGAEPILGANYFGTVPLSLIDWLYIGGSGVTMLGIGLIAGKAIRKFTHQLD